MASVHIWGRPPVMFEGVLFLGSCCLTYLEMNWKRGHMVRRQSGERTKLLHAVGASCLNSFQARQVFCEVSVYACTGLMLFERLGESQTIVGDNRGEKRGRSKPNSQIGNQRGMQSMPPWRHLRSQWTVPTSAVLGALRGKENGYRRRSHQASSFCFWGWWGKLIRKSHDSVGLQMGKV